MITPEQKADLLIEWSIYSEQQQQEIRKEYLSKHGSQKGEDHWLEFLKGRLEIEHYWKKSGLG